MASKAKTMTFYVYSIHRTSALFLTKNKGVNRTIHLLDPRDHGECKVSMTIVLKYIVIVMVGFF